MTPPDSPPLLHLIAGINGAGKTSFYYDFLQHRTRNAEFVNTDEIERRSFADAVGQRSYEAAKLAAHRRSELIQSRSSFVTETVFSHPSKLEILNDARAAGFVVVLYHIHVSTPELAVERVKTRLSEGGHDVPVEKVFDRYPRTLALMREAVKRVNRAYIFDNSRIDHGFTHVLTFESGKIRTLSSYLPTWVKETYTESLRSYLAGQQG